MSLSSVAIRRTASAAVKKMDRTFVCSDGFQLTGQHYAASNRNAKSKVLLLHGWLDNCRSFWKLAPSLAAANYEVVALDLPGHGKSDHRPKEAPSILLNEAVYYVADVVQQLKNSSQDEKVTLVGHSMGAAISLAFAAVFPEQVERLVLLESLGPISKPDEEVTQHVRRHVEKRLKGNISLYGEAAKGPRTHASVEAAIETRMKTATLSPGKQYISQEAAAELVRRAIITIGEEEGVQFTHDYRLTWPSLMYTTPGQMIALQEAVECPTCLLLAQDGWPIDQDRLVEGKQRLNSNLKQFAVLPGSHHFHADPEHCEAVTEQILQFLE